MVKTFEEKKAGKIAFQKGILVSIGCLNTMRSGSYGF